MGRHRARTRNEVLNDAIARMLVLLLGRFAPTGGDARRSKKRGALGFFGRQFEVDQVSPESLGLDGAEGNSYHHPDTADEPSFPAQIFPENCISLWILLCSVSKVYTSHTVHAKVTSLPSLLNHARQQPCTFCRTNTNHSTQYSYDLQRPGRTYPKTCSFF